MEHRQTAESPYISFVTAVRNDEYADPEYKKLKLNLKILSQQCTEHSLSAENILVEWNPDPLKKSIKDELSDVIIEEYLTVRIITVPSIFHHQWKFSNLCPMHPSVAINVGLRRARGQFCTLKTQDTFYDNTLVEFIAKKNLDRNNIYRTVRLDTSPDLLFTNKNDFLKLCKASVIQRNDPLPPSKYHFFLPNLFTNACGDFQLMAREHFFKIRGYPETRDVRAYQTDGLLSFTVYAHQIKEVILKPTQAIYKMTHSHLNKTRFESPTVSSSFYDRIFLQMESLWPLSKLSFWMRALFNYPKKFYRGKPIRCYERSVIIFKLLSKFSWLAKWKSSTWGYANQTFKEIYLHTAKWEGGSK